MTPQELLALGFAAAGTFFFCACRGEHFCFRELCQLRRGNPDSTACRMDQYRFPFTNACTLMQRMVRCQKGDRNRGSLLVGQPGGHRSDEIGLHNDVRAERSGRNRHHSVANAPLAYVVRYARHAAGTFGSQGDRSIR